MRVSFHIITRNRPNYLSAALASLVFQTHKDWELVIVDDSDPDVLSHYHIRLLIRMLEDDGVRVNVVRGTNEGIPFAYQQSMEAAQAELCIRHEDDIVVPRDYIQLLHDFIVDQDRTEVAAAGGCLLNAHRGRILNQGPSQNGFARKKIETGMILEPYDMQQHWIDHNEPIEVCHMHGGFIDWKQALQDVGGFATWCTNLGHREETDVSLRLYFAGFKCLYLPWVRSWHMEAEGGGSRDSANPLHSQQRRQLQLQDEEKFQGRLRAWMETNPDRWVPVDD